MSQVHQGQTKSKKERLFGTLNRGFTEDELRAICTELEIDYNAIPGANKAEKLRLLVTHLDRHPHKIRALVDIIKEIQAETASNGNKAQPTSTSSTPSQSSSTNQTLLPLPTPSESPPSDTPPSPPREPEPYIPPMSRPKFDYKQFGIPFGLGIVFTFILLSLGVFPDFRTTIVEVTREIEVTRLVEVVSHAEVTRLAGADSNTNGISSTPPTTENDNQSEIVTIESTAVPTIPPSPTSTPFVRPTTDVFTDDFERGLSADWLSTYGSIGMSNGNLTVVSPYDGVARNHMVILDTYSWENFMLTTHISSFHSFGYRSTAHGGILVRELGNEQWAGVLIKPYDEGIAFATFDNNGDYAIQSGSLVTGGEMDFSFRSEGAELRIEAYDDSYILYLNDKKITSATFLGSTSSRIAMWIQNSEHEDDSDSYAPRFEDIRIESIP